MIMQRPRPRQMRSLAVWPSAAAAAWQPLRVGVRVGRTDGPHRCDRLCHHLPLVPRPSILIPRPSPICSSSELVVNQRTANGGRSFFPITATTPFNLDRPLHTEVGSIRDSTHPMVEWCGHIRPFLVVDDSKSSASSIDADRLLASSIFGGDKNYTGWDYLYVTS